MFTLIEVINVINRAIYAPALIAVAINAPLMGPIDATPASSSMTHQCSSIDHRVVINGCSMDHQHDWQALPVVARHCQWQLLLPHRDCCCKHQEILVRRPCRCEKLTLACHCGARDASRASV